MAITAEVQTHPCWYVKLFVHVHIIPLGLARHLNYICNLLWIAHIDSLTFYSIGTTFMARANSADPD
jgi:hypothetical protein